MMSNSARRKGRCHLVLHHLHTGLVTDNLLAVFYLADAANIEPHRGIELQGVTPVVVSGLPNITPSLSRSWLIKMQVVYTYIYWP